jgi:hypothetical protein
MNTRYAVCAFVLLLSVLAYSETASEQEWKEFRQAYPYHLQVVAISSPHADGGRTLIISEPPPHITSESFQGIYPGALERVSIAKHAIGVNGWVKDLVVELPSMPPGQLSELLDIIHHKLFWTTYKAYAIPIPDHPPQIAPLSLDLHVTSGDLWKWLIGNSADVPAEPWTATRVVLLTLLILGSIWLARRSVRNKQILPFVFGVGFAIGLVYLIVPRAGYTSSVFRLRPITGGSPISLRSVLDRSLSGVFLSVKPGFVVWSIPRNAGLEKYRVEARQFSLDSDMIVGAVASDKLLAIVGRERVTPVSVLSPLRTETMLQLAAANKDGLAQSYERKFMFAGRFDQTNDWAPIYLSDELIDTEYGSLLNITDQMLKSWSNHGEIKYTNFDYPDPAGYPFRGPIVTELKVNELTFNWNTKGAGYSLRRDPYEVFALNRLGALPIDYLARSNSDLQKAEDTAYNYFNHLSDPNLVRVVQYAGLYQIFRRFQITAVSPATHHANSIGSIRPLARHALDVIASITDPGLDKVSAEMKHNGDSENDSDTIEEIRKVRDVLRDFLGNGDRDDVAMLVNALADSGAYRSLAQKAQDDETSRAVVKLASAVSEVWHHIVGFDSPENARAALLYADESGRTDETWIRTPTIVISHAVGQLRFAVGGHNLDARMTEFRVDPKLLAGHVRIGEENRTKVVFYSPADGQKAPELVRSAGRFEGKPPEELQHMLSAELNEIKPRSRPLSEVLGFVGNTKPAELRGLQAAHLGSGGENIGWRPAPAAVSPDDAAILRAFEPRRKGTETFTPLVITRNSDSTYVVVGKSGQRFEASDLPSAIDAVTSSIRSGSLSDVNLHFKGFDFRQAQGFVRTAELDLRESDSESRLDFSIAEPTKEAMSPAEMEHLSREGFDFSRAETPHVVDQGRTEEGLEKVDIEVKVPAMRAGRSSLLLRIRMFFDQSFQLTSDFLTSIQQIVRGIADDLNTIMAGRRILRDLKIIHPGTKGIHLRLSRQAKDVLLVHNHQTSPSEEETYQPV